MSTPRTEVANRTSSRQRRVAEETARIDAARRKQRQRVAIWAIGVVLLLVALLISIPWIGPD